MPDVASRERTGAPARRNTAPQTSPLAAQPEVVRREVVGLLTLGGAFMLALMLFSHRPATSALERSQNLIGPVGAFVADTMFFSLGVGSFIVAMLAVVASVSLLFGRPIFYRRSEGIGYGLLLIAGSSFFGVTAPDALWWGYAPGGLIGSLIGGGLSSAVGTVGAAIVTAVVGVTAFVLITEMSLIALLEGAVNGSGRSLGGALGAIARWRAERAQRRHDERVSAARASEREASYDDGEDQAGGTMRTSFATFRSLYGRFRNAAAGAFRSSDEPPVTVRLARVSRKEPALDDSFDTDPPWVNDLDETPSQPLVREPARRDARKSAPVVNADEWTDSDDNDNDDGEESGGSDTSQAPYQATTIKPASRPRMPAVSGPNASAAAPAVRDQAEIGPVILESAAQRARKRAADLERAQQQRLPLGVGPQWEFPPLSFLSYEEGQRVPVDEGKLREKAAQLEATFASFKVKGRVTGICPGPVVTRYEFEPEQGTKVSRISGLTDDIAMALKAQSVRIIAPIPGKGCVGIELPNEVRETVYLKEIIADERFTTSRSKLTVALGKDIEGNPVVTDLQKMPHLLVAGTTGSGKSVTVNAMIVSILYNASPADVRMIMIDPKQLEFAIYKDIPHLLLPVVTDSTRAAAALNWAVQEMERRYKLMSEMKVRDLTGYNRKLKELTDARDHALAEGRDPVAVEPIMALLDETDPDGRPSHRHMSYILVIVDEFADLMMVAKKDVETAVARLAQKARAAGIHVVLATQRPSVDVITGLIKANFPTRLSCRLMSGIDSRTVLDEMGAETLLGQGDMLFRAPGRSDVTRVHGAWVDEREIEKICEFVKAQGKPVYDESIILAADGGADDEDSEPDDPMYEKAVRSVIEAGFASISMVQRKLGIGYNRAAKMVEIMERRGIVGPAQGGSARREILNGRMPGDY